MIFLSVGFLERALNKGRGSEGYIITATCIPKDIYESCRLAVHHHGDHVDWSYQRHQ